MLRVASVATVATRSCAFRVHVDHLVWIRQLFTYGDTRDAFSIPYDIEITQEIYQTPVEGEMPGGQACRPLYNRKNKFFEAVPIGALVEAVEGEVDRAGFAARVEAIKRQYAALSDAYQKQKGSATFGFK